MCPPRPLPHTHPHPHSSVVAHRTSFERRVQLASTQRAWAALQLQATAPNTEPFTVEEIAKHVHIGWARSVVGTWAPEYGLEPLGALSFNVYGHLDSFNFTTADGYQVGCND